LKFGLCLPNFGGKISANELVELAVKAEEEGFDSVWVTDHIIVPRTLKTPYNELLEPLVSLSYIAARTSRVKLGTSILVLPQRNPFLVAKQAASLDQFSNGRTILGVGAGWIEQEYGYLGTDFLRRGKILDESIALLRSLWTEDTIDHSGRFFLARDAIFLPKPVQKSIPIWVGGISDLAIKRAARLGDGWHPVGVDPVRLSEGARELRGSGSKTISLRITVDVRKRREDYVSANGEKRVTLSGTSEQISKKLEEYAESGLEHLVAYIYHDEAREVEADVERFSREIMKSHK